MDRMLGRGELSGLSMQDRLNQMKRLGGLNMHEALKPNGPVKLLEVNGKIGITFCPGKKELNNSVTGTKYPCTDKIPVYAEANTASPETTREVLSGKLDLKIKKIEVASHKAFKLLLVYQISHLQSDFDSYMSNLKIIEKLSKEVQVLQKDLDNLINYSVTKGPGGGFIIYCDKCAGNMTKRIKRAIGREGTRRGNSAKK